MSVLELFCDGDDFMLSFASEWKANQLATGKQRERAGQLWPSEVMTILIHFHQSHYRTFKAYYTEHVQVHLNKEFPHLVSYTRFVALIPGMLIPLLAYAARADLDEAQGSVLSIPPPWKFVIPNGSISIGSLLLMPGVGRRAWAGSLASSCRLSGNSRGERLSCCLTAGNVDDRKPVPKTGQTPAGQVDWRSRLCLGSLNCTPF